MLVRMLMGGMAAISSPSTLPIELTRQSSLRLFGFGLQDSLRIYTG